MPLSSLSGFGPGLGGDHRRGRAVAGRKSRENFVGCAVSATIGGLGRPAKLRFETWEGMPLCNLARRFASRHIACQPLVQLLSLFSCISLARSVKRQDVPRKGDGSSDLPPCATEFGTVELEGLSRIVVLGEL